MPCRFNVWPFSGNLKFFEFGKGCLVLRDDFSPPGLHGVQSFELHKPYGRLDVGHVVLPARFDHLVLPRSLAAVTFPSVTAHTVQTQPACAFDPVRRPCEHPAFGSGQVLRRIKAESREVSKRSNWPPLIGGG